MTKAAAIEAMAGGYKVRHRLFSNECYIWWYMPSDMSLINNKPLERRSDYYVDDLGCIFDIDTFWRSRQSSDWETGWEIVG